MSEIIKLYENAGIKPEINYVCDKEPCEQHSVDCQKCSHLYHTREDYPDLTAEKQLSLIKLLSKYVIGIDYDNGKYEVYILSIGNLRYDYYDTLEETLAYCINNLWQFLTEEDHKQIKEILE